MPRRQKACQDLRATAARARGSTLAPDVETYFARQNIRINSRRTNLERENSTRLNRGETPDVDPQIAIQPPLKQMHATLKQLEWPYAVGVHDEEDLAIVENLLECQYETSYLLRDANRGRRVEANYIFLELEKTSPDLAAGIAKKYNFTPERELQTSRTLTKRIPNATSTANYNYESEYPELPSQDVVARALQKQKQRVLESNPVNSTSSNPHAQHISSASGAAHQNFQRYHQPRGTFTGSVTPDTMPLSNYDRSNAPEHKIPNQDVMLRAIERQRQRLITEQNRATIPTTTPEAEKVLASTALVLAGKEVDYHSDPAFYQGDEYSVKGLQGYGSRREVNAILQDCRPFLLGVEVGPVEDKDGLYCKLYIESFVWGDEDSPARNTIRRRLAKAFGSGTFESQLFQTEGWYLPLEFAPVARKFHLKTLLDNPHFVIPALPDWVSEFRFPKNYPHDSVVWRQFQKVKRKTAERRKKEKAAREEHDRTEVPDISANQIVKMHEYMEKAAKAVQHNAETGFLRVPPEVRQYIWKYLGYSPHSDRRLKVEIVPMQIIEPNPSAPKDRTQGPGLTSWVYREPDAGHPKGSFRRVYEPENPMVNDMNDKYSKGFRKNFIRRNLELEALNRRKSIVEARKEQERINAVGGHFDFTLKVMDDDTPAALEAIYCDLGLSDTVAKRLIAHAGNEIHLANRPRYILADLLHLSMVCRVFHEELTPLVYSMVDFSFGSNEMVHSFLDNLSPAATQGVTKLSLHYNLQRSGHTALEDNLEWDETCARIVETCPNIHRLDYWVACNDFRDYVGPNGTLCDKPDREDLNPANLERNKVDRAPWWNHGLYRFAACEKLDEVVLTVQPNPKYKGIPLGTNKAQMQAISRLVKNKEILDREVLTGWTWGYREDKGLHLPGLEMDY